MIQDDNFPPFGLLPHPSQSGYADSCSTVCEERVVTVVPNQEITAQAERGFGLGGAFPWASIQQNHTEAWLGTSGCVEQA